MHYALHDKLSHKRSPGITMVDRSISLKPSLLHLSMLFFRRYLLPWLPLQKHSFTSSSSINHSQLSLITSFLLTFYVFVPLLSERFPLLRTAFLPHHHCRKPCFKFQHCTLHHCPLPYSPAFSISLLARHRFNLLHSNPNASSTKS